MRPDALRRVSPTTPPCSSWSAGCAADTRLLPEKLDARSPEDSALPGVTLQSRPRATLPRAARTWEPLRSAMGRRKGRKMGRETKNLPVCRE